jgi:hypothetical protein
MVVQLYSYLLERQHQALEQYLNSQRPKFSSMPFEIVDLFGSLQPQASASEVSSPKTSEDLRMEAQQRVQALQQKLSIR